MDITINITFKDKIRHFFNPLHIYCRLTYLGMPRKVARGISRTYEACLYKPTIGRIE